MDQVPSSRFGDVSAMLRVMQPLVGASADPQSRRRFLASWCRLVGNELGCGSDRATSALLQGLSPRQHQTLTHLLAGDSEKQIAGKLSLSRHTVHVYVKELYRHFGASSRAELLARWVKMDAGAPAPK
jgi:DNA-binding CsgD family transcriptional regulator